MKRIIRSISTFLLVAVLLNPISVFAAADQPLSLTTYDGGFFSVMIPEGWQITTMGQYSAFGFRAWDPNNSAYEIFYYGLVTPLMKSEAAREWNETQAAMLPDGSLYHFYADAPVVDVADVSTVFYAFPELKRFAQKYGGSYLLPGFSFPTLRNLMAIRTIPMQTALSSVSYSEGIVFGSLQTDLRENCYGCFSASIWATPEIMHKGVDQSPTGAMNVTGVIAPQDAFASVQNVLTKAVFSLTFTQDYIDEANAYSKQTGDSALANNAERQEMFERYCAAWNEAFRQ